MKNKYLEWLNTIMVKYNIEGGLLHSTYAKGIETNDFNCCYIDDRVKNGNKIRKELADLLDTYFEEFPEAIKPLYNYK